MSEVEKLARLIRYILWSVAIIQILRFLIYHLS